MDPIRAVVKYVTDPLYMARDGYRYRPVARQLEASQWLSPSALKEMQGAKLRSLIEDAFRTNPFHRGRMDRAGVSVADIRSAEDLRHLPVLRKDDIRNAGAGLFSEGYSPSNTQYTRTGGSTGVPLQVYIDRNAQNWKFVAARRSNAWAGWHAGDKAAAVWGDTEKGFHWKAWLRNTLQHRTIYLDTLRFSAERIRRFHSEILDFKPTVLMGHAHSVYQFARFCGEHGLRIPRVSGIVTTAMTLSKLERRTIEEVFEARVFNRYGCEELGIIASESEEHNGLHVFSEGLILEYLPTEVPDEYELVITDLLNRAMPMIRYAIGDVVHKAAGGQSKRGLERLQRVSGRTADFLYRPDGTPVFGISLLDTYIIHIRGIHQAQMIQNDARQIDVLIVPTREFDADTVRGVEEVIAKEFGRDVKAVVTTVEKLKLTERGKYRFSICNLRERPRARRDHVQESRGRLDAR